MRIRGTAIAVMAIALLAAPAALQGQSVRSLVNRGNDLYESEKYGDAEVNYRKALEKDHGLVPGKFNLGNALHKQGKYAEAAEQYGSALDPSTPKQTQAMSFYNIGNSYLRQQQYREAIQAYVESLKREPDDYDAKYNLSYALRKLRQQQQQQQNKDDKKKNEEKKDKPQDKDRSQQDQPQPQQKERKMSKADAERILEVLKNNERDVQKKLRTRQAVRPRSEKDW